MSTHDDIAEQRGLPLWLALLIGLVVGLAAVTGQSLWIDEAQTAMKVIEPTLHGWWHALNVEHNSNMQLPLYMIYEWAWARFFGVSEYALRAANIPWFLLGVVVIFRFTRRRRALRNVCLLLYGVHPFVWYYLNEARPYITQLPAGCILAGCLLTGLDEQGAEMQETGWWWWLAAGLVIVSSAGLLGVPWAVMVVLVLMLARGQAFFTAAWRHGLAAMVCAAVLLAALGAYYAWTLKENVRAGYIPMTVLSIPWVFYEQFGFAGLGPGRTDLRSGGVGLAYLLPLASLAAVMLYALGRAAGRAFGLKGRLGWVALVIVPPLLFTFTLGFVKHFRVVGRHLTPMLPFIILAEAYAVHLLWKGKRLERAAALLLVLGLAISTLEIRLAPRHAKDDYRDAAATAKRGVSDGKRVWWAADRMSADYYHLPTSLLKEEPGVAEWVDKAPPDRTAPPDEVILSKPDLFDGSGSLMKLLIHDGYQKTATYQAFTVWERPKQP